MTTHRTLTGAQEETLSFIKQYLTKHEQAPTIAEMRDGLRLRSLRSVTQRLEALEKKGFTKRDRNQHRSITILDTEFPFAHSGIIQIPVIASAGCDAVEVFAQNEFGEFIAVDSRLVGRHKNMAAVRAVGDSMIDAGIKNGDYVIVEVTEEVSDGDQVVAVLGNMAVIKQYRKIDEMVYLNPQNQYGTYKPIVVNQEDSKIFGKVLSVIPGTEWVDDIKIEYYPGYP
ncbi:MAG: Repressor LexA [Parcubacteria group bacterium]|nr:Repressor LexA [Parcubacteria group bacterium]